jgi:membrane-bound inhibitor of C-type lysozyme
MVVNTNAPTNPDIIQAADFNALWSRINTILGNGFGDTGYGQVLSANSVPAQSIVTAAYLEDLRTDLNRTFVHQTGSLSNLNQIVRTDIIAADTSGGDTTKGFNDYVSLMATIEADRFLCDDTQASIESAISSTRTTQWNGSVTHEFTVTFGDADKRRHFFNAGGQIFLTANLSSGSGAKYTDWATMFNNMGTIKFAYNNTSSTGTGTGTGIGNYTLSGSYQTIFTKSGSGVYAENTYIVQAKQNSTTQIQFLVRFSDNDSGDPAIDENVVGTLTSVIQQRRPSGQYVSVVGPSYSNTSLL